MHLIVILRFSRVFEAIFQFKFEEDMSRLAGQVEFEAPSLFNHAQKYLNSFQKSQKPLKNLKMLFKLLPLS